MGLLPAEPFTRTRLLDHLRSGRLLRATVLEAPAGFGKSWLLRQALADADAEGWSVIEVGPTEAVPAARGGLLVAVDDAHRLGPDQLAALGRWVAEAPAGSHLVLAGRSVPLPGLSRWAVHGEALHLGVDDLAFDDAEVTKVASGFEGGHGSVDPALARWPALSRLVYAGADEQVVAYLRDEVVAGMADDLARLVAALCVVGDASRRSIDALVGALDLGPTTAAELDAFPVVREGGPAAVASPIWAAATAGRARPDDRVAACRALARLDHQRGLLARAAGHAIRAADPELLAELALDALRTQPPLVSAPDLERWLDSGLLGGGVLSFVAATLETLHDPVSAVAAATFERARAELAAEGHVHGEVSALLAAGQHARRRSDPAALIGLLVRGEELAATGDERAAVLVGMGKAVAAQLQGDPRQALVELDHIPARRQSGDWANQLEMIRATNLLLIGRTQAAIAGFERATGAGTEWSRSSAHDLLAMARWLAGDHDGAHRDADAAVRLAAARGLPSRTSIPRAARAVLRALDGLPADDEALLAEPSSAAGEDEAGRLRLVAQVLAAVAAEDDDRARQLLTTRAAAPSRGVRSSAFLAVLDLGLGTPRAEEWRATAAVHRALEAPVRAGEAAHRFRTTGQEPEEGLRPYLPPRWRRASTPRLSLHLCGRGEVRRDGVVVDHPRWARDRVRELCLHLVVLPDASRSERAAALWPELPADRAGANLRVTLSQLLDVIDPDRPKGKGRALVDERGNRLGFRAGEGLQVDVWDLRRAARRTIDAVEAGEDALAVTSVRLVLDLVERGQLLGGGGAGGWVDPHQRGLDELVLRALAAAGPRALAVGEPDLADRIGSRALALDPWAEESAQLVTRARLARHDLDGARRALAELDRRLAELEVPPQPESRDLFAQLGRPVRSRRR